MGNELLFAVKVGYGEKSHEVTRRELQVAYSMFSSYYQEYSHP
jgi:hypothetical protein